jgi:5-methyltetrahydropteroyltriglutamate--homocysteine methyltransferase
MAFHADHIGSLLRPPGLLTARRHRAAGEISAGELRAIEDEAIKEAVAGQEASGIGVITDGEFRRQDFRTGFVAAVDGIEMSFWEMPWHGSAGTRKLTAHGFAVTGRLKQRERLAAGEYSYLTSLTSAPVKVTLIAPGFLEDKFWRDGVTDKAYSSREELAADVAAITRAEIEALIAEGVSYIQLDNPGYGTYLGPDAGSRAAFDRMTETDAAAVAGVAKPDGVVLGLHICRGNQSSMWMSKGAYDPIAEKLFSTVDVDRFLLEYDDERSGGFEPLRYVPAAKSVVLGLVTSKSPVLEPAGSLRRRIDEAAAYIDFDRLALSPQCGFASVAEGGNQLTEAEQFAKLRLVADVARSTWN